MSEIFPEGQITEPGLKTIFGNRKPLGYSQLTSLSSATALTVVSGARYALIQAETQAVRYRDDGTNPTSSVGMKIADGESVAYTGDLAALRFIEAAASAKLNVLFYA
jgi:hypothetical protein